MHSVATRHFNQWVGWIIAIGSLVLRSFGIYLGRNLRWNSWDVISSPTGLLHDIYIRVLDPMAHPQTYGVTIIFSAFLVIGYLLKFQLTHMHRQQPAKG